MNAPAPPPPVVAGPIGEAAPTAVPATAEASHFERLGGEAAVQGLVVAFYRAMDRRPDAATIRAMHAADLTHTRGVLEAYLCEWLGGPKRYSPARGAPMLRRRHQPFDIDAAARDAWMACMHEALAEVCAHDPALRETLAAAFYKVADFIRNTEHSGEARPHPGRPREVAPTEVPPPHRSAS